MFEPKATAPHLDSTISVDLIAPRRCPIYPLTTDIRANARFRRHGPEAAIHCTRVRSRKSAPRQYATTIKIASGRRLLNDLAENSDLGNESQGEEDGAKIWKPGPVDDGMCQSQIEETRGPEGGHGVCLPRQLCDDYKCREGGKNLDRIQISPMSALSPCRHRSRQGWVEIILRLQWPVVRHLTDDIRNPKCGSQHRYISEIFEVGCHVDPPGMDASARGCELMTPMVV